MPGWIDTHTHQGWYFNRENRLEQGGRGSIETPAASALYAEANVYATLMGGFTTIQSLGQAIDKDVRDLINRGVLPGPRIITSLRSVNENTGDPEKIRAYVDKMKADGADVIKLFATASIRDGGKQTMTDEQIQATCSEATKLGLRSVVHAHAPGGARAAVLAGCTSIEHGAFLDDATLQLIADRGAYFDPNFLVLHNYLDNKPKFLGIGNYNEEGRRAQARASPSREDHSRYRCGGRLAWAQRRRVYLSRPRWRTAGYGSDRERHLARGRIAAPGRQDRKHCPWNGGRPGGRGRQSPG
jgi:imidazolonepropionase-like amidohydrolase